MDKITKNIIANADLLKHIGAARSVMIKQIEAGEVANFRTTKKHAAWLATQGDVRYDWVYDGKRLTIIEKIK